MFKVKYTQIGHIDRYKARLITKGFSQVQSIDFEKTFSSTLRLESLRMLLAFTTHFDYEVEQMDVPDAYFKKDLKENIYMKIFKIYDVLSSSFSHILKLLKPLYGLKQSKKK